MSKKGKPYEQVVAAVLGVFDPGATVTQGKWVAGPDGRRELDVLIEGNAGGVAVKGIVECKDFNPARTGPVGIAYVDALDSKRRDLAAQFAMICCNAGFTADAIRKAKRLGIVLAGVMRKGDPRLRFAVVDEIYTRKVRVDKMWLHLEGPEPIHLADVPFYEIRWHDIPVANWVHHRVVLLVGANPIVAGTFTATHELTSPLHFSWPTGSAVVTSIVFTFSITGVWLAQRVEIDSTNGLYNWLRRRVTMAPGEGQLEYRGVNFDTASPVTRPPDKEFLHERFLHGEAEMKLLMMENFAHPDPVPDLDQFIKPSDLDMFLPELPAEATTSVRQPA